MIPMMTDTSVMVMMASISTLYCSSSPLIMSMAVGMKTVASRMTYIRAVSIAMMVLSINASGSDAMGSKIPHPYLMVVS